MNHQESSQDGISAKVEIYLKGISEYLAKYRAREELTQNGMAGKLGLSLNRYREYEQNTTDNSKGVSLDLLLKICSLEGIPLDVFLLSISGSQSEPNQMDTLEEALLLEWRNVPLDDRQTFVRILSGSKNDLASSEGLDVLVESNGVSLEESEPLIPQRTRWIIRVSNLLGQLPYEVRMKFEREVIEEYMAIKRPEPNSAEHNLLLDRLRELIRQYYTHFEGGRR
jgi:transcriptional regulator with XRE-family HTH domain